MKILTSRVLWGCLLVLGGILFLFDNLGYINIGGLIWALIMAVAGLGFISVYLDDRQQWWALIPGFTLLGVAGTIAISELAPNAANLGGMFVLGGISVA